jgi:hypothetical protein
MTSALELVFVVDGEKRSGQPPPRKGDNKKKVALAKKHVEQLRKEARVLAFGLAPRVTSWMRDRQRWGMEDFRSHVLGHPILRAIAQGFVWATYDDAPFGGACTASFRVAEDGSFADVNEDPIDPKGRVGLLHSAEVEPDVARRWASWRTTSPSARGAALRSAQLHPGQSASGSDESHRSGFVERTRRCWRVGSTRERATRTTHGSRDR